MGLEQKVGDGDGADLGRVRGVPRVEVAAQIVPRPAEELALPHAGDVVGHEVVAEPVALVHGRPQLARARLDREADRVADAVRDDLPAGAVGGEGEHVGASGVVLASFWSFENEPTET